MSRNRHPETQKNIIPATRQKLLKLQLNPSNLYAIMKEGSPMCLQHIHNHENNKSTKSKLDAPQHLTKIPPNMQDYKQTHDAPTSDSLGK